MSGGPPTAGGAPTDERGQSEVIGVVLVLAIAVIGIAAVVMLGQAAVTGTERTAELERAEHGMTLLDARMAIVGLGESDSQAVDLQAREGSYTVEDETGWIRIRHFNYSGNDKAEVVYRGGLGSVVYRNGDTRIAYQGGGVWRSQGDGNAVMVSPPEFHYRDATLTLPILNLTGEGSVGGSASASISPVFRDRRVFPNTSTTGANARGAPYNDTSWAYENPIENGSVNVTIGSEYYRGWASYFRDRTDGDVTVNPDEQTVSLELLTIGDVGAFQMPQDGESIKIRGLAGGHPAEEFTVELFHDDSDSAKFSNLQWSLYADEGPDHFEIHLRDGSGGTCGGDVQATVYYSADSGSTYQAWHDDDAFQYECETDPEDFNGDGDHDDVRLQINFTSSTELTYQSISKSELQVFNPSGATLEDPMDYYETHTDWEENEPAPSTTNNTMKFDHVVDHYFSLMGPNFDLTVDDKNSNTVNEDTSSGYLELEGTGSRFITYLHVTENKVRVDVD